MIAIKISFPRLTKNHVLSGYLVSTDLPRHGFVGTVNGVAFVNNLRYAQYFNTPAAALEVIAKQVEPYLHPDCYEIKQVTFSHDHPDLTTPVTPQYIKR